MPHGLSRYFWHGPTQTGEIDIYGVGREGQKVNVLGTIDLGSLHVELHVMKHRTAEKECFVRNRLLFRHVTPNGYSVVVIPAGRCNTM